MIGKQAAFAALDQLYADCTASVEELGLDPAVREESLLRLRYRCLSVRHHMTRLYNAGYGLGPDLAPLEPQYTADPEYRRCADFMLDNLESLREIPDDLRRDPTHVPEPHYRRTARTALITPR